MTLGEVFDNLVKKVNREDSKINYWLKARKKFYITTLFKKSANK